MVEVSAAPQESEAHARASWAELFFDLVLVFAITQTAHLLAHHPSVVALGQAMLVLGPPWWVWVAVTLLVNAVEETHPQRLLLFTCGALTLTMAMAIPHVLEAPRGAAIVFAGVYLVLRLILAEAMRRKHAFDHWVNPYTLSIAAAAILVVGATLPPGPRQALWAPAIVLELATPAVLGRRLHGMAFGMSHLPERFGLFIIIALGETVVDVGARAAEAPLGPLVLVALILAFAIGAALWWLYFNFAASAVEHALRTHRIPALVVRDVLSYGHLTLVIGLIMTAVGLAEALSEPTAARHGLAGMLLPAGTALFTLTFCYTRWRMFGAAGLTRLCAGLLLSVLACLAYLLPGLALLGATATILIAVNLWEHWIVSTGRPIPLLFRTGTGN